MMPIIPPPSTTMDGGTIRPDYLSPSSVNSYLLCSARFYFEKILGLNKPLPSKQHVELCIHETIRTFHLLRWNLMEPTLDSLRKAYFSTFLDMEHMPNGVAYHGDRKQRYTDCLHGWHTTQAFYEAANVQRMGLPHGVEVSLQMALPDTNALITGTIDLVENDGRIVVYKISASAPISAQAQFEHEIQSVTYQMLMQDAGEIVSSLSLIYLMTTQTPRIIRIKGAVADHHRQQSVLSIYKAVYEGIVNGRFSPSHGIQCSECPYTRECMEWEKYR